MPKTVERLQKKSFRNPDETRTFEKGKVDLIMVGGVTIGRATFKPGWKWSTCVKPIAKTKSCEVSHLGIMLSGTLATKMDDGTQIVSRQGDVICVPPGHDGWVVGHEDAVFIDFEGLKEYAKKR